MKPLNLFAVAILAGAAGVASAEGPTANQEQTASIEKTRAQVIAETLEAHRLGLIVYGERDIPVATPEQERQIVLAGLRAREREDLAHNTPAK